MPTLPRAILPEELETYRRDGIVCLRQAFDSQWVEALRAAAEESLAQPGELHAELAQERGEGGRSARLAAVAPSPRVVGGGEPGKKSAPSAASDFLDGSPLSDGRFADPKRRPAWLFSAL